MRSIATIVAVLLCAAGGYWALQAAVPPAEYPTPGELDDAEQTRPEPPQLQERPDPIEFRWTLQPPEDVMAARTAVEMGTTWNATLEILNAGAGFEAPEIMPLATPACQTVSLSALGATASINSPGGSWVGAAQSEPPGEPPGPGAEWVGLYWAYDVAVSAPGDSDSQRYAVWFTDVWFPLVPGFEIPAGVTVVNTPALSVDASIAVSGLYLKCGRTSNPPDDRQLMDFSDQAGEDKWYADENTTVTVTCGPCSAQGALSYSNEEVEIGSNFALGTSMSLNAAPVAETVYARISGIKWGDTAVGGESVYLYNPGDAGDIPNGTVAPGWSRTKTTDNCARALAGSTQELCHLQGTTSPIVFSTQCWAPYILTLTPLDGMFSAEGPAYSIDYTSNCITYTDETTYTVDKFSEAYGPIVQTTLSWLYEWEWRRLSSTSIQVRVDQDWREANNENVGGETETQNDQRAGLCMWPLTAADRTSAPWWSSGFGAAHLSSIDINDTYGLPSRASPWTAGAGVAVDPSDNDKWTVTAGATAPAVSRSLATRYWLRLDRLSSGWTPGDEYHPDWPIMLKANLPIEVTLDDPDWWTAVPSEDITNWSNYRYVQLGINAARAGTVRVTIAYSVPTVSDPCYTGATYRWAEFDYSRARYSRSYDVTVAAGANTALIDLVLNREHAPITGAYRMQVVDSIAISLPANPGETDDTWTLTGLALVEDPGEGEREEPGSHTEVRYKRSWAWIGYNWFGFGSVVDGKDALEIDYGYGYGMQESKLLYIQHAQHNPDSEATTRIDAAKVLGRLSNELGWQEGWTTSWPSGGPEGSAENEDADEDRVDSSLYWWDIKQSTTDLTLANLEVALCCGTYAIAAGVPYDLRFYKYPRGAVHGIAVHPSYTAVIRDTAGAIDVYATGDGETGKVATLSTDEHGRYAHRACYELGTYYRLDGGATITDWLSIVNREYSTAIVEWALRTPAEPYTAVDECGLTWLVAESGGALRVYYLDARETPPRVEVTQPTALTGYSRPSIAVRGGELLVAATETAAGNTVLWSSFDRGETWEAVATDLGTGITLGTVAVRPGTGEVLLTGIDASDNVVLRMASAVDLPRDDLTAGVDEITITAAAEGARSTCQAHPDGSLIAAVQGASGVDFFRCRNLATGFVVV